MKRRNFLKALFGAPAVAALAVVVPQTERLPAWPFTLPPFEHADTADDLESTAIRATQIQSGAITDLRERVNGMVEALRAYGLIAT